MQNAGSLPPHKPTILRSVAGYLAGFVIALTLAEAALRLLNIHPHLPVPMRTLLCDSDPSLYYHCYSSNPSGELGPLPDVSHGAWRLMAGYPGGAIPLDRLQETPWCVQYRMSSRHFRDREYPPVAPPGVLRIAGIGDSFAMGQGVPLEKTLFRQMEALLGTGYEVINTGKPGADTREELEILLGVAPELHCTRAIVVFVPNDVQLSPDLDRRQQAINAMQTTHLANLIRWNKEKWSEGTSRIWELFAAFIENLAIDRETTQWYLDSYDPAINPEGIRLLEADFHTLATMKDCQVVLVLYPLMDRLEKGSVLAPIQTMVSRLARQAGLPVLDLLPAFSALGLPGSSLRVHPSDGHPTGKAHAVAARAIVNWLRKDVARFLWRDQ